MMKLNITAKSHFMNNYNGSHLVNCAVLSRKVSKEHHQEKMTRASQLSEKISHNIDEFK